MMRKTIKKIVKYAIMLVMILSFRSFALTVNNYNRYCEDGKLLNMEISFNDVVAKYNKYGQFTLGDNFMPTGNVDDPLSNEGDRDFANLAVESDTTYRIYGEIDEDLMDYSFYDYEDLTSSEIKVYELKSKLEALRVGNQVQERSGYGKYNLRNGKNLIAFLKFAYEFYKNSGEYRVGKKDVNLFKGTVAEGKPVCPMEFLDEYIDLTSTSKVELINGFDDKFRNCVNSWEYVGSKDIYNSDRIFETLEDIYMGLVYLYPGLKVLESKGIDIDELDDNDRAAIFSLVYEIKGMQPITSENISEMQLTKKFSRIGAGDLIGALIEEEELDLSVAETIYRYMIEIKYKNNPEALARWICEYEEVVGGTYEPLDAEDLDKFLKAYNVAFAKYGKDVSRATGLDYVFFGYVENPEDFQSKKSLEEATNEFANHLREHFSDSGFYRNRNNANFVAKSYMMAKKICENEAFLDITDIYSSDICLVEHSYGYGDYTTEVLLSDTQVVSLEAPIEEGYIDTDRDGVFDTDELGTLEEVNISKLIEAYIDYNELPEEEANKLRENPTVKMYNYISNPTLPDTDFDGRGDLRDRYRALDNSYEMTFDTEAVDSATYDLNIDYRYFYMDNSKYYAELSDMAVVLSNMATKKKGESKNWENKTEGLSGKDIYSLMYHYGNEDIEVHDMRNYYNDSNVCRYAIGQHDTVLYLGRTSNKVRNVITVAIGELPDKTAELTANLYGLLGSNEEYEEYHHIGYDITANRIYEYLLKYIDKYNNNQKVFFITGSKSAGGVANLLSKKLIDKFGSSSVYGYTFNAVSSINGNKIPEGKKIPNLKYKSIMNVYNDDEIMTMFTSEETNMYKYGTKVHMSLSDNYYGKVKTAYRYVHKSNYNKGMKQKVLNLLNKTFNTNLLGYTARVLGFTEVDDSNWEYSHIQFNYTESEIKTYINKDIDNVRTAKERKKLMDFFAGLYNLSVRDTTYYAFKTIAYSKVKELEALKIPEEYTEEEIKTYFAKEIHDVETEEEKITLLYFWSWLYDKSTTNSEFSGLIGEADNKVKELEAFKILEKIEKVSAEMGDNNMLANTDEVAFNNAITHAKNVEYSFNTAIDYKTINSRDSSEDNKESLIDIIIKVAKFYINSIPTYEQRLRKDIANDKAMNANLSNEPYGAGYVYYAEELFKDLPRLKEDKLFIDDTRVIGVKFKGKNVDINKYPRYTGDFCSDFAVSVIRILSNGYRGEDMTIWEKAKAKDRYLKIPKYGIRLHDTSAITMIGSSVNKKNGEIVDTPGAEGSWNFENSMYNLGWTKIVVTKDMTVEDLKVGDLLVSNEHVEFYIGDNYRTKYIDMSGEEIEDWKKSGIQDIKYNGETSETLLPGEKAVGTFGWGNVKDEFPAESKNGAKTYFFKNDNEGYFRLCQCGKEPNESDVKHAESDCKYGNVDHQYKIIWRKIR